MDAAHASDLELSALLKQAVGLFHQRAAGDTLALMNDAGLTMPQMVTLFALGKCGPHSVCDIADRLRLSRAATSHLVDRLFCDGLVEREENAGDRRQKLITLSTRGRALIERFDRSRSAEIGVALASLSPALRRMLHAVLEQVVIELRASDAANVRRRHHPAVATAEATRMRRR